MMKFAAALVIVLSAAACSTPTAPTTVEPAAQLEITYAINISDLAESLRLKQQYPNGVRMSPVEAQARWDYTAAYGGSPNVYYGATAPCHEYIRVGIVVAPYGAASSEPFTAAQWPGIGLDPTVPYYWIGRFEYAALPQPGSYTINPTC